MDVFDKFAPVLAGGSANIPKWFLSRPSTRVDSVIVQLEICGGAPTRLNRLETINSWFIRLRTSIECFIWTFQQAILTPAQIFAKDKSKLFKHIDHFLQNFALISNSDPLFSNVFHTERYQISKIHVLLAVFNFMLFVSQDQRREMALLSGHFFSVFLRCCMLPSSVGISSSQIDIKEKLWSMAKQLASSFSKLNENERKLFDGELELCLSSEQLNLLSLSTLVPDSMHFLPIN